jgi:23S rRNA pseudouridine1911/1915/1917 synthase
MVLLRYLFIFLVLIDHFCVILSFCRSDMFSSCFSRRFSDRLPKSLLSRKNESPFKSKNPLSGRLLSSDTNNFPQQLLPFEVSNWSGRATDLSNLILYEDRELIVIYKPPQVLSQEDLASRGKNSDDLVMLKLLRDYRIQSKDSIKTSKTKRDWKQQQPSDAYFIGLVHRIDRPSSGVMVYAKSPFALKELNAYFGEASSTKAKLDATQAVRKSYICMLNGLLEGEGHFEDYLLKTNTSNTRVISTNHPTFSANQLVTANLKYKALFTQDISKMAISKQPALKLESKPQTLVKVDLLTGRKHQIRVQFSHRGYPIVGDVKYNAPQKFASQDIALHSYQLQFPHPISRKVMRFSCGPPRIWYQRFGPDVMLHTYRDAVDCSSG